MKKILALLLALCMVFALAACGESATTESQAPADDATVSEAPADDGASGDKVIKIGVFEPQSGDNGAGGKQEILGMQYANSLTPTVEIGGETYTVELIYADNQSSNDKAVSAAQELMLLGPNPSAYLDLDLIISKAKARGVVGIHPGWGFASEDSRFPALCRKAGIVFIGASEEAMNLLGNKVQARAVAKRLGIPVVPGSDGAVDVPTARKIIQEIGLPIMLKAEGGGGGRGIFAVHNEEELEDAFFKASTMAQASFGNPNLFVEKFLTDVHHIEIQVLADHYGNVFAFDERDCTVQRNNQKLMEVTPSPWKGVTRDLREKLKDYARRLVSAVGYHSLATVEFLVTSDGTPYLIEVNTRLQVEHGITECRYGIDLVELGIQSFDDKALSLSRRGYTGKDAEAGCLAVTEAGLRLGIQLLPGMPGSSPDIFLADVRKALSLSPACLRF